jgi:EAL domain-containing protein (putative c-di-GMP-specific phosphodiesterase class I)
VREILLRSGLAPSRLELEVTESVLINDSNTALHVLRGIKNLGVSVALDDFGTGYSSLSTLISFPFDKIKIDRSFVHDCTSKYQAAVVVRTMIGTANKLGYRIIAEGVERQDQVDFLIKEGCHEMQGFLIGRPVSEHELKFTLDDLMPQASTPDIVTRKKAS